MFVGGQEIRLPATEDLIIMKAVAHRPRDIMDIEALIEVTPKLNWRRILKMTRDFSRTLEMPEILDMIEALRAKRGRRKRADG